MNNCKKLRLPKRSLRPGNEAHITKKLRKFGSDNVTWKIKSDPERPAWGATEKTNGKTCIFINKAFVQLLGSDSNHTSAEKMFASLALAEVILHELAHAFWIVTRFRLEGRLRDEPYFEGQHFNELGHALITSLFGGAISMRLPDDQPARAGELPRYGLQIQHLYDGVTPSFAAKVNFRAHREFVVRWIVGMLWMEKLFTQAFWDGEVQVRWKGLSPSSKETWVEASESYLVGLGKKERDADGGISEGIVRRDGHVDPGYEGESENDYSEDEANEQIVRCGTDGNETETGSGPRASNGRKDEKGGDVADVSKTEAELGGRSPEQEKSEGGDEVARGRNLSKKSSLQKKFAGINMGDE